MSGEGQGVYGSVEARPEFKTPAGGYDDVARVVLAGRVGGGARRAEALKEVEELRIELLRLADVLVAVLVLDRAVETAHHVAHEEGERQPRADGDGAERLEGAGGVVGREDEHLPIKDGQLPIAN